MPKKSEDTSERSPEGGASGSGISRRSFLQGFGLAAGAVAVPLGVTAVRAADNDAPAKGPGLGPGPIKLKFKINGKEQTLEAEPRMTLAEVLREKLDLTGTKIVCDRGACGACTVMLGGQSVCSCMLWAIDAQGQEITTIEGLAKPDGRLDPVQEGFINHDALQCGFCTPGFIVRCRAFLNENPHPTLPQIKEGLAGNICRCGTYSHIFAAVLEASTKGV